MLATGIVHTAFIYIWDGKKMGGKKGGGKVTLYHFRDRFPKTPMSNHSHLCA